jgi:hypothetical protein
LLTPSLADIMMSASGSSAGIAGEVRCDQARRPAEDVSHLCGTFWRAILMFNAGFPQGEAIGSCRGDPLYHASLDPSEYEDRLTSSGFELIEYSRDDPAKRGRIF